MLSVDEAVAAVLAHARPLAARGERPERALGRVLAEDIIADIDLPPFDKALMDGYAVRSADWTSAEERRAHVVAEIVAGRTSSRTLAEGECARIMTGAPLPPGADAVIMVERSRASVDGAVVLAGPVHPGLNRLTRGREMRAGDVLLRRGTRVDPAKAGLIASAGRAEVWTIPMPAVAVVPTGDELVPPSSRPAPGQIRDTNGIMLATLARAWGASNCHQADIAPDDPAGLRSALGAQLSRGKGHPLGPVDVLIVSGGVSAGTKDLVPATLIDLGVEPVFHKVNVRPGKPLWFGVGPRREAGPGTLVFGLPGNPASAAVSFLLFIRPALDALAGRADPAPRLVPGRLAVRFDHRGDRPTYHPARLEGDRITPLDWAGSADLRAVALADGFAAFPAGDRSFGPGDPVGFLPFDESPAQRIARPNPD